jgi:hypothetical protein
MGNSVKSVIFQQRGTQLAEFGTNWGLHWCAAKYACFHPREMDDLDDLD